jgi:RNA polymerase-binding transcription factor DksA
MGLTPEQLDELKLALTRRSEALETETHADAAKAREDVFSQTAGPVANSGDEAAADLISDVENAELSRDLQELRALEAALARVRDGSYGSCFDCGGDIGLERLRREPAASRCIECQRTHERGSASQGGAKL